MVKPLAQGFSSLLQPRLRNIAAGMTLSLGMLSTAAEAAPLLLEVQNIQGDAGEIRASIYREPESFRKEDKALQVASAPARAGSVTLDFDSLPPGRYAVMVYHDANSDRKLNLRFGMFPVEGYGLSNNPTVIGPPKFESSAFDLRDGENRIEIRLTY